MVIFSKHKRRGRIHSAVGKMMHETVVIVKLQTGGKLQTEGKIKTVNQV